MSVEFGPILDYGRVEDAILGVVRAWIDTYLVAVERENDMAPRSIVRPRSWKVQDDLTVTPERNMPVLYVVSAGEVDDPADTGDGRLAALASFAAVVALKDTDRDATRLTTRRYSAALAALLDHKLGTAGVGIRLASRPRQALDEAISEPPRAQSFIFGLAYVSFVAQIDLLRHRRGGPEEPFPAPTPENPDAPENPLDPEHTATNVTVEAVAMDEEV